MVAENPAGLDVLAVGEVKARGGVRWAYHCYDRRRSDQPSPRPSISVEVVLKLLVIYLAVLVTNGANGQAVDRRVGRQMAAPLKEGSSHGSPPRQRNQIGGPRRFLGFLSADPFGRPDLPTLRPSATALFARASRWRDASFSF